jgi:hypothetical protein
MQCVLYEGPKTFSSMSACRGLKGNLMLTFHMNIKVLVTLEIKVQLSCTAHAMKAKRRRGIIPLILSLSVRRTTVDSVTLRQLHPRYLLTWRTVWAPEPAWTCLEMRISPPTGIRAPVLPAVSLVAVSITLPPDNTLRHQFRNPHNTVTFKIKFR